MGEKNTSVQMFSTIFNRPICFIRLYCPLWSI